MEVAERLKYHLEEAKVHTGRIQAILPSLQKIYPLTEEKFSQLTLEENNKLDVLAFRFAKLQDILGTKIFREYLSVLQYPVENKAFLELLQELDKEKILDIDLWSEFRSVRNSISHDYPFDDEEKVDAINYLIEHIEELMEVTQRIRRKLEAIG